jgi:hypothetical protein
MATIKAITDLEQSKKLAEFLPIESADMMYHSFEYEYGNGAFIAVSKVITNGIENDDFYIDDIPCWSLAALLNVLPFPQLSKDKVRIGVVWMVSVYPYPDNNCRYDSCWHDNPVDACVDMIIKLSELKML